MQASAYIVVQARRLDIAQRLQHSVAVFRLLSRLAALTTILTLGVSHVAECQGWLASPEARVDCCADEQQCPMHKAAQPSRGSSQRISQSDADRCCATSEHGASLPTSAKAKTVAVAVMIPTTLPEVVTLPATRFDQITTRGSGPPTNRSRHVLLSVFLI